MSYPKELTTVVAGDVWIELRAAGKPTILPNDREERFKILMDHANSAVAQIRRHVDNVYSIEVKSDARSVCKFCYSNPEPATQADVDAEPTLTLGMPYCCGKAQKAFMSYAQGIVVAAESGSASERTEPTESPVGSADAPKKGQK